MNDMMQISRKWSSSVTLNCEKAAPIIAAVKNPIDQKAWLLFIMRAPKACSTRSASRLIATSTTATKAPQTVKKIAKKAIWLITAAANWVKQIKGIPKQIILLNGMTLTNLSANKSVI